MDFRADLKIFLIGKSPIPVPWLEKRPKYKVENICKSQSMLCNYINFITVSRDKLIQSLVTDWTTGIRFPAGVENLLFATVSRSVLVLALPSTVASIRFLPEIRWSEHVADRAPTSSADFQNMQSVRPVSHWGDATAIRSRKQGVLCRTLQPTFLLHGFLVLKLSCQWFSLGRSSL
jgi:hypothetical protein